MFRVFAVNGADKQGALSDDSAPATPMGAARKPTLDAATSTHGGFTVQISNFDANWQWIATTGTGSASISSAGLVTVTGLSSGQSTTVTVTTKRANYADGSGEIAGNAITETPPAPPAPPVPPAPVVQDQHVAGGAVPAKLKRTARKPIKLPTATDGAQRIQWVSATPKICKVVRGKLKLTGKRGTCRLVGVAPAAGNFRPLRRVYAIRVR